MYRFSSISNKNLEGVHPSLKKLMITAIENSPIDFTITEGVRTSERQKELYNQGRTTLGVIVTNVDGVTKKSNHQVKSDGYGYAVDLYPYINGSVRVNDINSLIEIATHIKSVAKKENINITWGGDWNNFKDYPHFELCD